MTSSKTKRSIPAETTREVETETLTYVGPRARARRKLTDEALARIFDRVANGMHRTGACAEEGCSEQALRQLAQRDPVVAEGLEMAEARGAEYYRTQIVVAATSEKPSGWSAFAWLAERYHPRVFPKPTDTVESHVQHTIATPEVVQRVESALLAAKNDDGET